MKTKQSFRILSLLLCALMCVSLFPAGAFAENSSDLTEAVEETVPDNTEPAQAPADECETAPEPEAVPETEADPEAETLTEEAAPAEETVANDAAMYVVEQGSCGKEGSNLTFELDDYGNLTISGEGEMADYTVAEPAPWYGCMVDTVEIGDGVTSIGNYAFYNLTVLRSVIIGSCVAYIGDMAFGGKGDYTLALAFTGDMPEFNITDDGDGGYCGIFQDRTVNAAYPAGNATWSEDDDTAMSRRARMGTGATVEWDTMAWNEIDNVLTIIYGIIPDYPNYDDTPWWRYMISTKEISIGDRVTRIGSCAFKGFIYLEKATVGSGVQSIGAGAFAYCGTARLGSNVTVTFRGDMPAFDTAPDESRDAGVFYRTRVDVFYPARYQAWKDADRQAEASLGASSITFTESGHDYDENHICMGCGELDPNNRWGYEYCGVKTEDDPDGMSVKWVLYFGGVLVITGSGDMRDWTGDSGDTMPYYCQPEYEAITDPIVRVVVTDGVTRIGNHAFTSLKSLQEVVLPDSVTAIGDSAFYFCPQLTGITIPGSVKNIGENAFAMTGLTEVNIPLGVETVGAYAFDACKLRTVVIDADLTAIGEYAFASNNPLETVTVNGSLPEISNEMFNYCNNMKQFTIPASVTRIGEGAFSDCSALESLTIPAAVTEIGDRAFDATNSLKAFTVEEDNTAYCSVDGVLFTKDMTCLVAYPAAKEDASYEIPGTVTKIAANAFSYSKQLKSVTIPDSVTQIGAKAFEYSGLTAVTIPDGVTVINRGTFMDCSSLTSAVLGSKVTEIGDKAFQGTGLKSIIIPAGVYQIGDYAFSTGLKEITFLPGGTRQVTFSDSTFYRAAVTAYYPAGSQYWPADVLQNYGGTVTWHEVLRGDVNNDGAVNLLDLLQLKQALAAGDTSALNPIGADVIEDGTVNLKDLLQLKRTLAGITE